MNTWYHDGSSIYEFVVRCPDTDLVTNNNLLFTAFAEFEWLQTGLWWLRIEDDGVNRIHYWSIDGVNWIQRYSGSRTADFTATKIGYGTCSFSTGGEAICRLLSWKVE